MRKVGLFLFLFSQAIIGISQCEDMDVDVVGVNPTCHDFCDGAVFIDVVVAAFPAEVTVTDSLGDEVYALPGSGWNFLCEGWYYISVVDSLGCVYSDSVELFNPDLIVIEYTIIPPSAPGICDGLVEIDTITGYQGDYEDIGVFWFPGGDESFIYEDMCAGNYTITVNDVLGCTGVGEFSIGSLAQISVYPEVMVDLLMKNETYFLLISNAEFPLLFNCFDMTGKLMETTPFENGWNAITAQPCGVYMYQLLGNNGEMITSGKISF